METNKSITFTHQRSLDPSDTVSVSITPYMSVENGEVVSIAKLEGEGEYEKETHIAYVTIEELIEGVLKLRSKEL